MKSSAASSSPLKVSTIAMLVDDNGDQAEEVSALCRTVIRLKDFFEDKDEVVDHEVLSGFAVLSVEIISSRGSNLSRASMFLAWKAGKILMKYLLEKMQRDVKDEEGGALALKRWLGPFTSFCSGTSCLKRDECLALLASLKKNVAKLPGGYLVDDDNIDEDDSRGDDAFGSSATESLNLAPAEMNRPQTDLTGRMLSHLMTPIEASGVGANLQTDPQDLNAGQPTASDSQDSHTSFVAKNVMLLQSLKAGDQLIDVCCALPDLKQYISQWEDATAGEGTCVPASQAEALAHRQTFARLAEEVDAAWRALSLPVLEPLNPDRLSKLTKIVMGCLLASVSVATTQSIVSLYGNTASVSSSASNSLSMSNDDLDVSAVEIVEKSLELFSTLLATVRQSTRAGGHILQNITMMGAWILVTGLRVQLTNTSQVADRKEHSMPGGSGKSKSESTGRINLTKAQQGFGVLSVALGSQALNLTSLLLEDLSSEIRGEDTNYDDDGEEDNSSGDVTVSERSDPATFDLLHPFTAMQRAALVLNSVPLVQLLFHLGIISYRKSCHLRCASPNKQHLITATKSTLTSPNDQASGATDSCIAEDDITCSEIDEDEDDNDDDNEDDSEPILGKWFADTLFPPDEETASATKDTSGDELKSNNKRDGSDASVSLLVPQKGEPAGFVSLASHVFIFLNKHIVNCESKFVRNYIRAGLTEQQMSVLAAIVRDLDFETYHPDSKSSTDEHVSDNSLAALYEEFSGSVASFNHNLMAYKLLTTKLQDSLLSHLMVSPEDERDWPLRVFPRTLSLLAHILLLRQNAAEKGGLYLPPKNNIYVILWEKVLSTLTKHIFNPPSSSCPESEDLNVEHVQLLLFFFHALALMQKKQVLLLAANNIIKTSKLLQSCVNSGEDLKISQIYHFSRLILLFEYMMKCLYEPPKTLMDQVQQNIFKKHLKQQTAESTSSAPVAGLAYHSFREIEDNMTRLCKTGSGPLPRFYNLYAHSDMLFASANEVPKLDGLAISFILGTADTLHYGQLYEALINSLQVVHQTGTRREKNQQFENLSATQYCFSVTWRLLQSLPPSIEYLEDLVTEGEDIDEKEEEESIELHALLHKLMLSSRLGQKVFVTWIKDALVKQGQTTAKAEAHLKKATTYVGSFAFDFRQLKRLLKSFISKKFVVAKRGSLLPGQDMPKFFDILLLDAIMAKVHISFDKIFVVKTPTLASASAAVTPDTEDAPFDHAGVDAVQSLVPLILQLVESFSVCAKSVVLQAVKSSEDLVMNEATKLAFVQLLSISGSRCQKTSSISLPIDACFPGTLKSSLQKWNESTLLGFPPVSSWRNQSGAEYVYIAGIINTHVETLSSQLIQSNIKSLKHCLYSAARFAGDLFICCPDATQLQTDLLWVLFPLILDGCTENLSDLISLTLERAVGRTDSDEFLAKVYFHVLTNTLGILLPNKQIQRKYLDDKIKIEILKFMEEILDRQIGRTTLEKFLSDSSDFSLVQVLMSASSPDASAEFASQVLKFFLKLFVLTEKHPSEIAVERLCSSLARLSDIPQSDLEAWLSRLVTGQGGRPLESEENATLEENRQLLQMLAKYIVEENNPVPEEVSLTLLSCLIPLGNSLLSPTSEGMPFADLISILATLASAGSGVGHVQLFRASTEWLATCRNYLSQKNVIEKLEDGIPSGRHAVMVENSFHLLSYMSDVVTALKLSNEGSGAGGSSSPLDADQTAVDIEADWLDEVNDDDDSATEDSDDDSLNNRLCTFTQTQKEFMNQHWYHCHTCKMVDGVGVCTICARVCHAGHDVTYSKHGSFFCDCGAKEDGSCIALVKRTSSAMEDRRAAASYNGTNNLSYDSTPSNLLRRRASSPPQTNTKSTEKESSVRNNTDEATLKRRQKLSKKLSGWKEVLADEIGHSGVAANLLELLRSLMPAIEIQGEKQSSLGRLSRLQDALKLLHVAEKTTELTDQLMLPTLGSQEGAFENVRMSYSGDQGQSIRQLVTTHMIRRVVMCCLSSGGSGKRQHLAVAHEKGKITMLQLSALLKQADSSQKKLTLTRLSSAPVPFTVLSVVSNPCNEDYLAVTGLKDCHVLAFNSNGSVADHLVLHPQLDAHNYIVKAIWMAGSQTEIAVVTADFVRIYDLGKDVLSPQYYFLVPSGKIRDCTLAFTEEGKYVIIMSSAGHIYFQALTEDSSAVNGPFYVTNIMTVSDDSIKDTSEQIGGGGVSIYYSHTLQMLFFSYVNGKSFMAPLKTVTEELETLFHINVAKNTNSSAAGAQAATSSSGKNGAAQPLCQWSEICGHPGLVTAFLQSSNNPVIIMIKPEAISVQEIKVGSKSKIADMVAIRHASSNHEQKTTLILLCEDGSLKIFMANVEGTNFWLTPITHPMSAIMQSKPPRKKKQRTLRSSGSVSFPVDFFEHCSQITDLEFGGADVLQIYNVNQIRNRLQTTSLYIANTKPGGFQLEVTNNDSNQVMVGVRVLLGSQDVSRIPSSIQIFGRSLQVNLTRSRWFDFPLTRDESLQADKKLTITFGPSLDAGGVNLVDCVQVYGKTKEIFEWPEDQEEFSGAASSVAATTNSLSNESSTNLTAKEDSVASTSSNPQASPLERVVIGILESLDGCFATQTSSDSLAQHKSNALALSSKLLTIPTQSAVEHCNKALLSMLFPTRSAFFNHKDNTMLRHVVKSIHEHEDTDKEMGVETYQLLVLTARMVAVTHPQNLVRFAEVSSLVNSESDVSVTNEKSKSEERRRFMMHLINWFWQLLAGCPVNASVGTLGRNGFFNVEATVQALVEIFHAFTSYEVETVPFAAQLYSQFLMADNVQVSFAAKQALIRVLRPRVRRRRVFAQTPPRCPSPDPNRAQATTSQPSAEEAFQDESRSEAEENDLNVGPGGISLGGIAGNFDALIPGALGGVGGANAGPVLELPGEIDDEAMVELAIALSLQEQGEGGADIENLHQGLQGLHQQLAHLGPALQGFPALQGLAGMLGGAVGGLGHNLPDPNQGPQEPSHYSDTTASAPGSDDEGGGVLQSPPEDQDAAGSESGGSVVESITGDANLLGRRSSYEAVDARASRLSIENIEAVGGAEPEWESANAKLHSLRLLVLDQLVGYLPKLREVGSGVRCIPFMQVILMLSTDLDGNDDRDKASLDNLLSALVVQLDMQDVAENVAERSQTREMQLVILRHVSILMSRSKSWQGESSGGSSKAYSSSESNSSNFTARATASALLKSGSIRFSLHLLYYLLNYWKTKEVEETSVKVGGNLLKTQPLQSPPDMSPFFLKQYVKSHAHDIFEAYPQLLTEMALRIPYQCKKIAETYPVVGSADFDQEWHFVLCEYMMTHQTPYVRRQVRKLLLYICGTKEKYRELRDLQALDSHMKKIKAIVGGESASLDDRKSAMSNLSYDTLLQLIEHLKACVDVATSRTLNWQKFCLKDSGLLAFLLRVSVHLDDGVTPIILQLLQSALCPQPGQTSKRSGKASSPAKAIRREKSKSQEPDSSAESEDLCIVLVNQVSGHVDVDLLSEFIERFLLDCNATSVRWQGHGLIVALLRNASADFQTMVIDIFWKLWPHLPCYGRKAAQFVDLLGYFTMKSMVDEKRIQGCVEEAVDVLKSQNLVLASHPNSNIYGRLTQLVEFNGYYLESDPCLVCNNPEVPYSSLKLSTLKVDTKYTTTTQIVKLSGSHSISKISLRIGDLKRQKMVRTINIYYNNRSVQAVVELKNKPTMWHKAKKVSLTAGQTDIKIEFPLPIVACNLMIEYADYYENIQASSETLQCPRCSASVPANPGVCSNCGENVFQCHKCRSINYDEKDPFLCNACGFCKYAKFEYTLATRPCCAVDPIENEDDRKKAIANVNTLLEKADKVYNQLVGFKPAIESLLIRISESTADAVSEETSSGSGGGGVNQLLVELAQRYCGDCKNAFEELSKIIQKVMATRKELVSFDESRKASSKGMSVEDKMLAGKKCVVATKCYGCASSSVEHCLTLLRALAAKPSSRIELYQQGLIEELMEFNLRRGTNTVRHEVRKLICLLTRDNPDATEHLNQLIRDKIGLALIGRGNPDLVESARHEMSLLAVTIAKEDACWEIRLRCVLQLFLMSTLHGKPSPTVMECITLPCLKILQGLIKPTTKEKPSKEKVMLEQKSSSHQMIDIYKWLAGHADHSFTSWEKYQHVTPLPSSIAQVNLSKASREEVRAMFLKEKYFGKWRQKMKSSPTDTMAIAAALDSLSPTGSVGSIAFHTTATSSWLKNVFFNPSSRIARQVACNMVETFFLSSNFERKKEVVDLLTTFLDELKSEASSEFVSLYHRLISTDHWKYYLSVKGVLTKIASLITREIETLNQLERVTLNSDLAQGFALKTLTDLLSSFVVVDPIKMTFKGRLVSTVLFSYLSLRRLVVQRTKLVDQTQDKLLELLDDMTTGTEEETKSFMAVCVETINKYTVDDQLTPVFIFERLCNLIYPEETDTGEFFLTLEKDPQQEDFLQGRMLGNPYSSNDPSLGPLMREIKNKICRDCELVALLEDDNGMELLVNNKIISLDLPVKDVYQRVWLQDAQEGEPMRIIYRMRGLLGDATEEFIENLASKENDDQDDEEVYRLANVMAECGGLEVMLKRLSSVNETQNSKQLIGVLLKLFGHCIRVKANREKLLDPSFSAIPILLHCLKLCLAAGDSQGSGTPSLSELILETMERLLAEATKYEMESYCSFASDSVEISDIRTLLEHAVNLKAGTGLHQRLLRVLPFLTYGNDGKMALIISHFEDVLDFDKFDADHGSDDDAKMEAFVALCDGIERNAIGNTMKKQMIETGVIKKCLDYLMGNAPAILSSVVLKSDDHEWKEYVTKPALRFILRALAGLSVKHSPTQLAVSEHCIPILHQIEQVSSDEHVGSLAEAVLEAIRGHPEVDEKVKSVRNHTKAEKKKLAMAMRAKQLKAIGLQANEQGQVKADNTLLQQFVGLAEESGLCCSICREGYKFQPNKVLGIYTYTRPCHVEEFESSASRKTMGYSTVTHFNLVHVDCHIAAVRLQRVRDEWESAMLQNANTRCNGLLPLWGPQVAEAAFASCLAKHNTYLLEATRHRDIGYQSTIHDLKLLLLRFAQDKSFSNESGGGGPQSNMHLVPYLIHTALYVMNTTRAITREEVNLNSFLDQPRERWLETCYVAEGPLYFAVLALNIASPTKWKAIRVKILQRLLLTAHARSVSSQRISSLGDREVKEYEVYKLVILFFSLIDQLYAQIFSLVPVSSGTVNANEWSSALADWIRHNDDTLLKSTSKLLTTFQEDLLPATSVDEIADVCGLLDDIPSPASFLLEVLAMVP